jgi:arylsulfatase A-like enzyme
MENIESEEDRKVDRRTFLKGGLVAGGALTGAGMAIRALADTDTAQTPEVRPTPLTQPINNRKRADRRPNILVIVVDQLRFPQWYGASAVGVGLPKNLLKLRQSGVSFARHYTASNDCTPARSTLLTGLYTHQTGCMITGGSTLDPRFPTWGTMLREHGYHTRWLGKWHLTHHDGHWTPLEGESALEQYGFAGGVFPSPDGGPGQGWRKDPEIAQTFHNWYERAARFGPWCTTVSFVNPHDIAWWYVWSQRVASESTAPRTVARLPPNFETPADLEQRNKPRLQRSLQATAAASFGPVPFEGPEAVAIWLEFMDLYTKLQREVDKYVGHVLQTLQSDPEVAENTVVVFTSDHGEYGASHGLRGKGASAYEEAIRVPLIVNDLRGKLTASPGQLRTQLTSSVDVVPLLLTIATGSDEWRSESRYAHIAHRADLAAILADPAADGREYVLHATDEMVTEFAIEPYAASAPLHVVALRTEEAKYATYTHWGPEGIAPVSAGTEVELYDYRNEDGRLETHNGAGTSDVEAGMRTRLQRAYSEELRRPLPPALTEAHAGGFDDYFSTARHSADAAAARRKQRSESELGPIGENETPAEATAVGAKASSRGKSR